MQAIGLGAGLLACAGASAQLVQVPLLCQRASITVFQGCGVGARCPGGPGGGPGMSQLLGAPSNAYGATGSALAGGDVLGGYLQASAREVFVAYTVPDVRQFATSAPVASVFPVTTRTWVIKASAVPGAFTPVFVKGHVWGTSDDFATSQTLSTTTAGNTSLTGSWLVVGQVEALAVVKGYYQTVNYGFSCKLPVQNLILQNQQSS